MASDLERAKLARLARGLNRAPHLPPLILMTDEIRVPEPVTAAANLPKYSAIIVRHRDERARWVLARQLKRVADERDLLLLVSGDADLAREIAADGLHLPERNAREAAHWKALRPQWLITVAAHSFAGIAAATRARADAALLAPVFPTRSHPDRAPLGGSRFRLMARNSLVPVYALGGVNATTAAALVATPLAGVAAIDALIPDYRM